METILIATDFSSAARNATRYGFALSKALNAKVILFTAYQLPSTHPESMVYLPANDLEKSSYQQLATEAETFDSHATVALETQCRQGPVGDAIMSVAAENKISYIVIGMKRTGKELRKYFGSTVTSLTKKSSIPLIVVPQEAGYSVPKTIAFASDFNDETNIHILEPLKKIAVIFNSAVSVVRVIKKSMNEATERLMKSEKLDWFLACLNHSFEYLKDDNVAKALNNFVKEHAIDLVAVIPHEHSLTERIFNRSVTKDLIFHTHVPLLILPEEVTGEQKVHEESSDSNHKKGVY